MQKKIVCLGGGIGTVNLLKGLKTYTKDITVVVSMADDGGSSGRLRRLYNMLPVGDLVSCMAAMSNTKDELIPTLLKYRFSGERYGKDAELGGHKLGNLLMVALRDISGSYEKAIAHFRQLFDVEGEFLPATNDNVTLSAITVDGKEVHGEEKIDLGKYRGRKVIKKVHLQPTTATLGKGIEEAITSADLIILGPGDLYTNLLPVLIVPGMVAVLQKSHAKKMFIVNVANKPFETKGYSVHDFINAIMLHTAVFPFDSILINNNFSTSIPLEYKYSYVPFEQAQFPKELDVIAGDFVNTNFPLYHDSKKLAKAVWERI